ncbi:MAG: hypothetical protein KGJ01_00250 [Patescibacteria group bacterium]|nr:hypothetical protein [Patescibacteria group bacterium]
MAIKSHNFSRNRGFTITELLIYLGIFGAVSAAFYGILSNVMETNMRETSANEITSQLNTVLATVQRQVKDSSQIEVYQDASHLTFATSSGSYLMLRTLATSTDPTCVYLSNGVIKLAVGPDPLHKSECTNQTTDITTSKVVANSLTFTVAQQAGGHAFVQIDAELSNNTSNPKLAVSKEIQSVIGRASAATFDSDLLPNADNTYSVGQTSPDMRWRNGSFAGTVTIGTGASGGNLGIGTKTPGAKLDIGGNVLADYNSPIYGVVIKEGTASARGYTLQRADTSVPIFTYGARTNSDNSLYYAYLGPGYDTAWMYLNNGSVGIGTSTPAYPLDIQATTGQMQIKSTSSTNYALLRINNAGGDFYFGRERSTGGGLATGSTGYAGIINAQGSYPLQFAINNQIVMTILNNGNVGIGTTSPGQKLDVIGNIRASGVIMPGSTSTPPTTCVTSTASSIYYNSSDTKMYYCNGTTWKVLGATASPPATGTIAYTTPGTYNWTVPGGVYRVFVQMWGAGGSGGLGDYVAGSYFSGGGGSSGSYGSAFMNVVPLSGISVVVGQGGNGISPSNGSNTSFGALTVNGGNKGETFTSGGGAAGGTAPPAPTGTVWLVSRAGNAGATSWGGDTNSVAGGGGGAPSLIGAGTPGLPTPSYNGAGGDGGSPSNIGGDGGGYGGNGATYYTSHTGNPGGVPGGGGGGSWGLTSFAAGNGGSGQVIIWW